MEKFCVATSVESAVTPMTTSVESAVKPSSAIIDEMAVGSPLSPEDPVSFLSSGSPQFKLMSRDYSDGPFGSPLSEVTTYTEMSTNHTSDFFGSPKRKPRSDRTVTFVQTNVFSFRKIVEKYTGFHPSSKPPLGPSSSSDLIPCVINDERSDVPVQMSISSQQEREIVGRAGDQRRIMQLIMSDDPSSDRVTVVCITAAGGLGKTTLASLVYHDGSVCSAFDARGWLCLSEICDYDALLRSVVSSLTGVSCCLLERDELEEVLKDELMGKKFLLVLDDACDSNLKFCRDLLPLLSVGDKGSAVLVTTRSNMAARYFGTAHAYQLEPLTGDSLLLLAKSDFVHCSQLEDIISRLLSRCSGVLMFAKTIRSSLNSAFSQKWLGDSLERKLTDIMSNPDNQLQLLLCFSYRNLRPNQRMCFLYCSLFPKGYIFDKEKLLRLWMSQGFIVPKKGKHKDEYEDAFNELLHRSFFNHLASCDIMEQKYVAHEVYSHLARSTSGDKFFRVHGHEPHNSHCKPKDVRHLSFIPKQCDSEVCFSSFIEFTDLNTFLLVNNHVPAPKDSQFHVHDLKALDELFRNFRHLKTLDLSHTDIKELPESIANMSSLCFLGLNNTNIRRLPNSMCNLFNLQTLELQNSAYLVELPKDIKNLANLCHLDFWKEPGAIYVPPGIGQLTNLQTLTAFTVGGVSWNCEISELAGLNSLEGYLRIQNLDKVENTEDARRACLAAKKLDKLSLEWCHSGDDTESDDRIFIAESVLDALKPYHLVVELIIKGYCGREFPLWTADYSSSNLVSITLDNCYNCEKLPSLGLMHCLRYLFIHKLRKVRVIGYEFSGTDTRVPQKFPMLQTLKLCEMYDLESWSGVLDEDFPSLRSLSIARCPKLNFIPSFQFLSDISVQSCSKLNLRGMHSFKTMKVGGLKHRKSLVFPSLLYSLQMLEVSCCDHLSSVDGLIQLQSLKQLKLRSCPKLEFSRDEQLPDAVETVDIHHNCYALRNWRPNGFEELSDASQVRRKFVRKVVMN